MTTEPVTDQSAVRTPLKVDDTFAWAIVSVPIVSILLAIVLAAGAPDMAANSVGGVVGLILIVLNTVFASNDRKRVMAAGYAGTSAFWGFLLMPIYLIRRARQVGNWAIPLCYGFTFLVYLAIASAAS